MKKTILAAHCAALLFFLNAPLATAQTPKVCKDLPCLKEAIANMANAGLAKKEFVGMSVVVVDRDKGSFDSHFGYRDLEKKLPATKDTIYEIGSITKPFSFLTLAAQDKIKLDDPIYKYLPKGIRNPQPGGKDILFKHLVTHTSRLPKKPCLIRKTDSNERKCFGRTNDREDPYKEMTEKAFYEFIDNIALEFEDFKDTLKPPGYVSKYSSVGAALVGELVARTHAVSFEQYVHTKLLDPLKMSGSFLSLPCPKTRDCSQLAKVYRKRVPENPWRMTKHRTAPFAKGTGRMKSTTVDMEKFLRANLDPESTAIASTLKRGHALIPDVTKTHNGNVCTKDQDRDKHQCNRYPDDLHAAWLKSWRGPVLWHNGATTGSQSYMAFTLDGRFGVVVMQNSLDYSRDWADLFGLCILQTAGVISTKKRCEAFDGTAR